MPGAPTRMWTYGGSFPGPTIRRPAGQDTKVTFQHSLPADEAGELTVHLHGGHNPSDDDGQPGAPPSESNAAFCDLYGSGGTGDESQLLIHVGESRTYTYPLMENGAPERAAFQWYHDHRCHRTAQNVWRGLAGMWIIDDAADQELPLPRGEQDIPLMITDRSLNSQNQLTNPFSNFGHPPNDGHAGRLTLVNGAHLPHHRVDAQRYRLRILNASGFRSYNLVLSNGASMIQIATEGGLMPKPLERRRILLGPGERAEVLVDFADFPHRDVVLRSVRRHDGVNSLGSKAYEGPLMQFRVGARRPDSTRVPAKLRPLPGWVHEAPHKPRKTWKVGIEGFSWAINGRTYDPTYVEHEVDIDTTETWRLKNATGVAHLIHLHHTDWYMLSRNGQRPPAQERCLKETFFLDPHDEVVVAGHFSDHTGKFIVHCHMLDHEDHGLMSQFEVTEPTPR